MIKTDLKISRLMEMLTSQDEEIRELGVVVIKNSFMYQSDIEFILNNIIKCKFEKTSIQNFINALIEYNDKYVSVYFDGYSDLGYMVDENNKPIPYFEYYDGDDCYRYYMNESEQMMNDIEKFLES